VVKRRTPTHSEIPAHPGAPTHPGTPPTPPQAGRAPAPPATRLLQSDWVWILAIVFLVAAFFHPVLLGGKVFSSPDAQAPQGFAVYAEGERARTGEYPLWNPFIFCGMPSYSALAYNPEVYFPDWIFKLLGGLAPPMLWLISYYMLGAVALFALLRDRGALAGPAALGALVFALTPNLIAVGGHGHGSQLVNSGLIPVVLLALHRFLARGSIIWLALLALSLGCQLLRGHVQIAFYTWIAVAIYLGFYVADRRRPVPTFAVPLTRGLGGVALALLLAVLLGAVLILPVAAYTPHSIRGGGPTGGVSFEYATSWSLGWAELWTLLVPSALGFGGATYWGTMPFTDYPNAYMGILTLGFAAFGLWQARGRGMGFFIVLAVFGLLVALGKHFFVYDLLYRLLPYWKKFRVPVMVLVLTQLAVASLFALGLTRMLALARQAPAAPGPGPVRRGTGAGARSHPAGDPPPARAARLCGRIAAGGFLLLVLVLLAGGPLQARYAAAFNSNPRIVAQYREAPAEAPRLGRQAASRAHKDLVRSVGLLALAAAGGHFLLRPGRGLSPGVFVGGVALASAVDLVPIGREILAPVTAPREVLTRVTEPDPAVTFLSAQPKPFRIYPLEEFRSNRFSTFGIASVGGYHAAKPRAYQEFLDAFGLETVEVLRHPARYRILDLLNVRYLVTAIDLSPIGRFPLVHEGPMRVYENPVAGPRAFLVGRVEVRTEPARALERLADPSFDLARQAVVASDVGPLAHPNVSGTARIVEHELNRVTVEVESSGPALLVLGELYDAGWRAAIDGKPAAVVRADHIFRGVRVEGGAHRVQFDYTAPGLALGLGLSVGAGAAILALAGLGWFRRGRRV
jgi:hypothetical protein